ncbi:MAG: 30S ribosomal protein S13 [Patescibacteria group bacterium]
MARISGINLPKEKRIEAGLTAIHGIGRKLSAKIIKEANVNKDKKVQELSEPEVIRLREIIDRLPTEGDLRRRTAMDIKRLQEIGCYRGIRHKKGLPVRGQRTQCNCRTRKGRRKTVANKKIVAK